MSRAVSSWRAPKRVRRFQSVWRGSNGRPFPGKMHAGQWHQFWFGREWVPACMTEAQERVWSTMGRGAPGRTLTAGATAPITCAKCIEKLR